MKPGFNCSKSDSDIRDYNLEDAVGSLAEQKKPVLFGIWNITNQPNFAVPRVVPMEGEEEQWKIVYTNECKTPEEVAAKLNEAETIAKKELEKIKKELKERPDLSNLDWRDLVFRQYNIIITSYPYEINIGDRSVLIPLNPRYSEQELPVILQINENNEVVLKDEKSKIVGALKDNYLHLKSHFIDNQSKERRAKLFIGKGFTRHDVTLEDWPPVEEQTPGHLCAANAGVALIEYFERVSGGRHIDASRLFLHQAACKLLKVAPDSGVTVKSVVAALTLFGVPPEEYWPYDLKKLNEDPPDWCYTLARNWRATSYLRLDRPNMNKEVLIAQIKVCIYSGLPVMFGFSVHESIEQAQSTPQMRDLYQLIKAVASRQPVGQVKQLLEQRPEFEFSSEHLGAIPLPTFCEVYQNGHTLVAVGYDDEIIVKNFNPLRSLDQRRFHNSGVKVFLTDGDNSYRELKWNQSSQGYEELDDSKLEDFHHWHHLNGDFNGMFVLLELVDQNKKGFAPPGEREKKVLYVPERIIQQSKTPRFATLQIEAEAVTERVPVKEYLATKGAFRIRNSWGRDWGDQGYGWLPYAYVYRDLTFDWWSILKFEWIARDDFGPLRLGNNIVICPTGHGDGCPH